MRAFTVAETLGREGGDSRLPSRPPGTPRERGFKVFRGLGLVERWRSPVHRTNLQGPQADGCGGGETDVGPVPGPGGRPGSSQGVLCDGGRGGTHEPERLAENVLKGQGSAGTAPRPSDIHVSRGGLFKAKTCVPAGAPVFSVCGTRHRLRHRRCTPALRAGPERTEPLPCGPSASRTNQS